MNLNIRPCCENDYADMEKIWNEVIEAGNAFPYVEPLSGKAVGEFFSSQTFSAVAEIDGVIRGVYVLHPNNVGRCSHVANASYAVSSSTRGQGLGRALVTDSLKQAARLGFRGLQFNAVVASNVVALHLYEELGFRRVGMIPEGFVNNLGVYEDMYIFYKDCKSASERKENQAIIP